jgi:monothiol glutaredoxin
LGNIEAIVYMKPFCSWTSGVLSVLKKHKIPFKLIDVSSDLDACKKLIEETGQHMTPCVEINGHMLADVGGTEVEEWITKASYKSEKQTPENG